MISTFELKRQRRLTREDKALAHARRERKLQVPKFVYRQDEIVAERQRIAKNNKWTTKVARWFKQIFS